MMTEEGLSESNAAALLSIFAVTTIPSRLLVGVLADRAPKHLIAAAMGTLIAVAALVLAVNDAPWGAYVFVVLYGVAWGGSGASLMMAIRGEYFGRKRFATLAGMGTAMVVPAALLGPWFAGRTFDVTGNYDAVYVTFIALALASGAVMLPARRPAR